MFLWDHACEQGYVFCLYSVGVVASLVLPRPRPRVYVGDVDIKVGGGIGIAKSVSALAVVIARTVDVTSSSLRL